MGRTSKSAATTVVENVVVASAPVATETAPVASATTARRAKKDKVKETETVSVAAVPSAVIDLTATAPQVSDETETQVSAEPSNVATKIQEFGAKLQQMSSLFASMKTDYKALERTFARELKTAQKSSRKRKVSTGTRQPSGFVKPTLISSELAAFLGRSDGIEMARTDVSREINAYIREKGLQDKENGRKIHPDARLSKLLAVSDADELTYFNIQRYMKHHFIKTDATAAVATSTA